MNAKQLMVVIEEKMNGKSGSYYLGLRGMYADEGLGTMKNSLVWDDGNKTDEELDGTCAVIIGVWWDEAEFDIDAVASAIDTAKDYGDGKYGLLVGDDFIGGEDIDEVIIRNAECVYVF